LFGACRGDTAMKNIKNKRLGLTVKGTNISKLMLPVDLFETNPEKRILKTKIFEKQPWHPGTLAERIWRQEMNVLRPVLGPEGLLGGGGVELKSRCMTVSSGCLNLLWQSALIVISWQKQGKREFIVLCEEMFISTKDLQDKITPLLFAPWSLISTEHNTQTHKYLKLGMSEKVGGHSLPNRTQTSDGKYKASSGSWVTTGSGYSVSPRVTKQNTGDKHLVQGEL
ncbi:hypothetical protein PROFUN_16831, partial [Planoprotostelium fungivorum]